MSKINNLEFIASYLFLFPGVAASEIRRALYVWKEGQIDDGFDDKLTYAVYFNKIKNRKGYVDRLWSSPKRTRWILQPDGIKKVRPEIFEDIKNINSCVAKKNSSYFNIVRTTKEEANHVEAKATY